MIMEHTLSGTKQVTWNGTTLVIIDSAGPTQTIMDPREQIALVDFLERVAAFMLQEMAAREDNQP